jgi:hypothetical protein
MTETPDQAPPQNLPPPPSVNRWALYFGLVGGPIAWLIHLLVAYVVAEFGCLTPFRDVSYAGITAIAWIILGVTVLTLLAALAATYTAYRLDLVLEVDLRGGTDTPLSRAHLARLGIITSGIFAFIIIAETIPVFYFLRSC